MADGNYLTVIVLNFVIALCMLGTPLVVHSLVGGGLSAMTGALAPAVAGVMVAAPAKTASALNVGREALSNTHGFSARHVSNLASHVTSAFRGRSGAETSYYTDQCNRDTEPAIFR